MRLPGAVGRHAARFLLAPLVAFVAYLAFPRAGALLAHAFPVGSVATGDVIAPIGFLVPKPEPQRVREAEAAAATVRPLITAHPEAADSAAARAAHFFAVLDSAAGAGASLTEAARDRGFAVSGGDAAALGSAAMLNRVLAGNVDERGFVTNEHRYLAVAQRVPHTHLGWFDVVP